MSDGPALPDEFGAAMAAVRAVHDAQVGALRNELAAVRAQLAAETRRRRETRAVLDSLWDAVLRHQQLCDRLAAGDPVAAVVAAAADVPRFPAPKRRSSIAAASAPPTPLPLPLPPVVNGGGGGTPPKAAAAPPPVDTVASARKKRQLPPTDDTTNGGGTTTPKAAAAAAAVVAFKGSPVRKRAEREKLPGHECSCCKGVYDTVFGDRAAEVRDACSRHRAEFARPETPPGFWDVDFPESETQDPRATKQRRQQQHPRGGRDEETDAATEEPLQHQRGYTGAGVLPFAQHPQDGTPLVLLHTTTSGKKSGMLVDFGGHAEPADHNDPVATAERELREETNGRVTLSTSLLRRCVSVRNRRGYVLFLAPTSYRRDLLVIKGAKGREFVWVSVSSILSGDTELPLFERITSCQGFTEAIAALIS